MLKTSHELVAGLNREKPVAKTLETAEKFLLSLREQLSKHSGIDELVISADEGDKAAKAFEHHLTVARNAFACALWGNEFFVGMSLLENIIFQVFTDTAVANPIARIADILMDVHDLGEGVAVFPLHSVRLPTTVFSESAAVISLDLDEYGIRVYPQANSFNRALQHLSETVAAFGISNPVPDELLEHWNRSRPLEWFSNNPLLIVRLHNIPGTYYENQRALLQAVHFSTSLLYGLAALSPRNPKEELFNTRMMNNRATLDYRHYLALYPVRNGSPLAGDCISMRRDDAALVELSDLDIFLSSEAAGKADPVRLKAFADGLAANRRFLFSHVIRGTKESSATAQARLSRKLTSSLRSFRRSHFSASYSDERVMNLATAFEVLLTDNYSIGVGRTLNLRTEEAMIAADVSDAVLRAQEVAELYDGRCEVTHAGAAPADQKLDLDRLRETYVIAYSQIAAGLSSVSPTALNPVQEVLSSRLSARPPRTLIERFRGFRIGLLSDLRRRIRVLRKS